MRTKNTINGKVILSYIMAIMFVTVILPLLCIWAFPDIIPQRPLSTYNGKIPQKVSVYRVNEKKYEKISFEKYVEGVVASEMPTTFEPEALKAQAVASRTYALGRIDAGTKLCDTVHCQVYRDRDISRKVKRAVEATKGEVLIYMGELASHSLYFSSSGGPTENSEEVFSTAFPYLRSVSSDKEYGATHCNEKTIMSIKGFSHKIRETFPKKKFGKIKKGNIEIISHSKGGRVASIKVGKEILRGIDIRSALGLSSARFTIDFKGNRIEIVTNGSGHGVGMSQYGANGMAEAGATYDEILRHYYKGTDVAKP